MALRSVRAMSVDVFFNAVADATRRHILLLLRDRECCVSELVRQFAVSQPSISRHLAVLRSAGLVEDRRVGQHVYYRLNGDLMSDCCSEYFGRFPCCTSATSGGEDGALDSGESHLDRPASSDPQESE